LSSHYTGSSKKPGSLRSRFVLLLGVRDKSARTKTVITHTSQYWLLGGSDFVKKTTSGSDRVDSLRQAGHECMFVHNAIGEKQGEVFARISP